MKRLTTKGSAPMRTVYPSGLGAGGRLGADIAAGARLVFDHHLLAPDFGQPVGDDASDDVGPAAGRERHHKPHEAVRPGLRLRAADNGRG